MLEGYNIFGIAPGVTFCVDVRVSYKWNHVSINTYSDILRTVTLASHQK
jgi:hypothetical protein